MLESIPHSSPRYRVSKKDAFEYFKNFLEYPSRYPKYCSRVEIIDRGGSMITTKELWNVSLGYNDEQILITVRYELDPYNQISYEIIAGHKVGVKNRMYFPI